MTGYEYRKKLEAHEARQKVINKLMYKYHLNSQDALRFYWERVYKHEDEYEEIYEEGRKNRNS